MMVDCPWCTEEFMKEEEEVPGLPRLCPRCKNAVVLIVDGWIGTQYARLYHDSISGYIHTEIDVKVVCDGCETTLGEGDRIYLWWKEDGNPKSMTDLNSLEVKGFLKRPAGTRKQQIRHYCEQCAEKNQMISGL